MPQSDGEEKGKKRNRTLLAKDKPLSQRHQNFARLLFQGATIADAAEKCGFSFSYARKLAQEPVIKERKKQLNEEYMADARKLNAEGYQEVAITRNTVARRSKRLRPARECLPPFRGFFAGPLSPGSRRGG